MKRLFTTLISAGLLLTSLNALTLDKAVDEALSTNPIVIERLKNYRMVVEDLNIAKAGYLPDVDWKSRVGYEDLYRDGDINRDLGYYTYTHSLTLTQNIYNGFATKDRINYQKARILAASHNYIETANDVAFNMVKQYINVLKNKALLSAEETNVRITQDIYSDIQDVYDSGFITLSDVKKVASTLQLAQFNMLVQRNNLMDSEYNLEKLLGRDISYADLELPVFTSPLPINIEQATMYAVENNPSLKVTEYNLEVARMLLKESKTGYLPELDIVLDHTIDGNKDGFTGFRRQSSAMFVLNYNLYAGGADEATIQKNRSLIHKEFETQKDIKRQVIEGLKLSWSAYTMIEKQLYFLRSYSQDSKNTLELYGEEFDTGQKTLLDLLTAQDDYIRAQTKMITAEHDWLFSKYRIMDSLGEMVNIVFGVSDKYYALVNLAKQDSYVGVLDDKLNRDIDTDKVDDRYDLCDNSVILKDISDFGCSEKVKETTDEKLLESNRVLLTFKDIFLNSKTAKYTISLSTYSSSKAAQDFINRNKLHGKVFFYNFPKTDRIKILYGAFDTKAQARAVLKDFSLQVLLHKPFIDDINKHREFYKSSVK